jgi:hypothetical protein
MIWVAATPPCFAALQRDVVGVPVVFGLVDFCEFGDGI